MGIAILLIFFALFGLIGWACLGRTRTLTDQLVAGRRFGPLAFVLTQALGGIGATKVATVAGRGWRAGAASIWVEFISLAALPLLYAVQPILRRLRLRSLGEFYVLRFGPAAGALFTGQAILGCMLTTATMLIATSHTLQFLGVSLWGAQLTVVGVVLTALWLCISGGQRALIIAMAVDCLLVVGLSLVMAFPSLGDLIHACTAHIVGESVPTDLCRHLDMTWAAPPTRTVDGSAVTCLFVIMFTLSAVMGLLAQPLLVSLQSSASNEKAVRISALVNGLLKRGLSVVWMLWGIALVAVVTQHQASLAPASQAVGLPFGRLETPLLSHVASWTASDPVLSGLLMIWACGGAVSTCGLVMLAAAGLFVTQLQLSRPGTPSSSDSSLKLTRVLCVLVALCAWGLSLGPMSLREVIEAVVGLPAVVGLSAWIAIYWRRYNSAAFIVATAVGYGTWVGLELQAGVRLIERFAPSIVRVIKGRLEVDDGWQMLGYLSATLLAGVITALLTRPERGGKFERFQELVRTPAESMEPPGEPCRLPPGVQPGRPALLIDRGGWQIPRPRARTLIGVAACSGLCAALIAATWLLLATMRNALACQ